MPFLLPSKLYVYQKYSKNWPYDLAAKMGCVCSKIFHGLPISVFKFLLDVCISYMIICQKPAHFLSAQNSEVFIVLGIYNFGFLTKERDLRPNHLEQYWPYWKWKQQTVCYVSLKLADRPKMEPKFYLKSNLILKYHVLFVCFFGPIFLL